jgi:hypothetical protein
MLGLRPTSAIQGWPKGGGGPAGIRIWRPSEVGLRLQTKMVMTAECLT